MKAKVGDGRRWSKESSAENLGAKGIGVDDRNKGRELVRFATQPCSQTPPSSQNLHEDLQTTPKGVDSPSRPPSAQHSRRNRLSISSFVFCPLQKESTLHLVLRLLNSPEGVDSPSRPPSTQQSRRSRLSISSSVFCPLQKESTLHLVLRLLTTPEGVDSPPHSQSAWWLADLCQDLPLYP
ncbi:hypothetical protein FRC03_002904 [Tulasnella sp. 419]|nr:hypothetical protein FRC03_002904 [Tulasnella sp. 419]